MTLESQYNKFLFLNSGTDLSFNEWKEVHGNEIKQAIINMMKDDEKLGLYDYGWCKGNVVLPKEEPFKHKVEVLSKEEILANRSNAYEFIDFDKQETLNEVALEFAKDHHEMYETNNFGAMHFGFIEGAKWREKQYTIEEQHIGHSIDDLDKSYIKGFNEGAEWQQERSYSEEEVIDIAKQAFVLGKDFGLIGTFNEWFEQFKKK